jgi:hypothetical protein
MAGTITDRMKGAAMLEIATYEEVEHDTEATMQAAGVVILVSIAQAIGSWNLGITAAFGALAAALVGWGLWSGITYLIGDKLFGGTATWGELLRTIGFAHSPGVLAVLGIVPLIGWAVWPVIGVWTLIAGVIAIRQALDFSTGKAVMTAVLGFIPFVIIMTIVT